MVNKNSEESQSESVSQEYEPTGIQNEFEVIVKPPSCPQDAKSSLFASNGVNIATICVNELQPTSDEKQIELIVQQKRIVKPSKLLLAKCASVL